MRQTETETDCTSESDDKDSNDVIRGIVFPFKTRIYFIVLLVLLY